MIYTVFEDVTARPSYDVLPKQFNQTPRSEPEATPSTDTPTRTLLYIFLRNLSPKAHSHLPMWITLLPIISALPLAAPQLDQPPRAQDVAAPQQRRDVDVERAVGHGVRQQHAHGAHALEHRVRRRPLVLEQVQADLARLQRDVGVHDRRREADRRRLQRVRRRDGDVQEPAAVCENAPARGSTSACVLCM